MGKEISVMDMLHDEDLQWIASLGKSVGVDKNQVLIREGEPVDSLFILLDGCLDIVRGGHQVLTVHSGEILGEVSFVNSRPPMATVTAAVYSKVLAIPRDLVGTRLASDAGFAARFFRALATLLAARLRITTARLAMEPTVL